jgi:hypothetical protein
MQISIHANSENIKIGRRTVIHIKPCILRESKSEKESEKEEKEIRMPYIYERESEQIVKPCIDMLMTLPTHEFGLFIRKAHADKILKVFVQDEVDCGLDGRHTYMPDSKTSVIKIKYFENPGMMFGALCHEFAHCYMRHVLRDKNGRFCICPNDEEFMAIAAGHIPFITNQSRVNPLARPYYRAMGIPLDDSDWCVANREFVERIAEGFHSGRYMWSLDSKCQGGNIDLVTTKCKHDVIHSLRVFRHSYAYALDQNRYLEKREGLPHPDDYKSFRVL